MWAPRAIRAVRVLRGTWVPRGLPVLLALSARQAPRVI